jgi:hypothetical protein
MKKLLLLLVIIPFITSWPTDLTRRVQSWDNVRKIKMEDINNSDHMQITIELKNGKCTVYIIEDNQIVGEQECAE